MITIESSKTKTSVRMSIGPRWIMRGPPFTVDRQNVNCYRVLKVQDTYVPVAVRSSFINALLPVKIKYAETQEVPKRSK